tara:strand:+ start:6968 stop:8335 length:1368 start_codon:yes stop_codon:yes gene_type:complete
MFLRDSNSKEKSLNQGNKIKKFFKDMNRLVSRSRIREGFDSGPDDNDNWYNENVSPIQETVDGTPSGSIQDRTKSFNDLLKTYIDKSTEYYQKQGASAGKEAGVYKLSKLVNGNAEYYLVNNLGIVRKIKHYKTDTDTSNFWNPKNASNNDSLFPHISCAINAGTKEITPEELESMNYDAKYDIGKHEPCFDKVDIVISDEGNAENVYYITDTGKKRRLDTKLYSDTPHDNHSCKVKNDGLVKYNSQTIDKIADGGDITSVGVECKSGNTGNDIGSEINQLNADLIKNITNTKEAVDSTRVNTKKVETQNVSARGSLNTSHTKLVAEKKRLADLQGNTLALKRSFEDSVKDANVLKIHFALWVFAFILTCVLIYLDYDSTYVLIAALGVIGISFTVFIIQQIKKIKKKLAEALYKRKQIKPTTGSKKDNDSRWGSGAKVTFNIKTNASNSAVQEV